MASHSKEDQKLRTTIAKLEAENEQSAQEILGL